jgi:sulfur-carrier protein
MAITIEVPGALRPYAGGDPEVSLEGACPTVAEALRRLAQRHPGVVDRVVDERGELRRHVNVFVDGEDVRFLAGLDTSLPPHTTLTIVPSVSGG